MPNRLWMLFVAVGLGLGVMALLVQPAAADGTCPYGACNYPYSGGCPAGYTCSSGCCIPGGPNCGVCTIYYTGDPPHLQDIPCGCNGGTGKCFCPNSGYPIRQGCH